MAAAQPYIFSGQDFSLQRDKNRFVLPPQFRKTLKESNHGGKSAMLLVMHDRWPCIVGFGDARIAEIRAEIDREEEMAARKGEAYDREKRALDLYTYDEVPFDGSGRFVLPADLADLAAIDGEIYYQGGGTFFTLWGRAGIDSMGPDWDKAKAAYASRAAQARARATKK